MPRFWRIATRPLIGESSFDLRDALLLARDVDHALVAFLAQHGQLGLGLLLPRLDIALELLQRRLASSRFSRFFFASICGDSSLRFTSSSARRTE